MRPHTVRKPIFCAASFRLCMDTPLWPGTHSRRMASAEYSLP